MTNKMNPVVHFEMPGKDMKRMMEFYNKVFSWETKQMGQEMGGYVVVSTTETDENQIVKTPGAINGGFYQRSEEDIKRQRTSVVISVDDIEESIKKVEASGGKIEGQVQEIPGVGLWVTFSDTEGNFVSMLQSSRK